MILTVILPFSFVGCKDKNSSETGQDLPSSSDSPADQPDDSQDNNNNRDESGNDDATEPVYVLDISEVIRIFAASESKIDNFVAELNESKLFEENNVDKNSYTNSIKHTIKQVYYPSYFSKNFVDDCSNANKSFELDRLYAYSIDGGKNDFLRIHVEENNKIILDCLSENSGELYYFCYNFFIVRGEITSLNYSYYNCDFNNNMVFDNFIFDFKNKKFKTEIGKIYEFNGEAKDFFDSNFTADNFSCIINWSYVYYSEINLGESKQFSLLNSNDAKTQIVSNFSDLGFMSAFNYYNEFKYYDRNKIFGLIDDMLSYGIETEVKYIDFRFNVTKEKV